MIILFFLTNKYLWIVAWALQSIGYYFVLKKIGEYPSYAIIPFFAEWRISKYIYNRNISFLRPFLITLVILLAGFYMNPSKGMGLLLMMVAAIIYFFFLQRLYRRLIKAFRKRWWYYIIAFLFPPLFLFLIGKGKEDFVGPTFKISKYQTRFWRYLKYAFVFLISLAEVAVITVGVSLIVVRKQMPRFLANRLLAEVESKTKEIVSDGNIVTREEALGDHASIIETAPHSREYYFADHDNDKNVVVLEYIIGSNLENAQGLASANIRQMKDVTTKGDNLKFVLQTGGSFRWFTSEIPENSNGRYVIEGGIISEVEKLDDKLCMSEPQSLTDFLNWGKQNYPADRYILVLWDHGGGFSLGYGSDSLNRRKDGDTMLVNEMIEAIDASGMKFDVIGFDACLMQTLETALAFEPYADYYIASEESEGGYGWFYTSAFGKLAEDPTTPTLDFAKELISAYDVYNTAIHDGKIDSSATLSVVDLTMVKPVYEQLSELFKISNEAIKDNSEYFADISLSASNAYCFGNKEQIDLINYLEILDSIDYDNTICKDGACEMISDSMKAAIPYRNKNSAEGINGMTLTFPLEAIYQYEKIYDQFNHFDMEDQKDFYNSFFSILVATNKNNSYYASEEWYVKGFEDYDTTDTFIDIPLTETENGYHVELPEKIKKIISDVQVAVYQRDGDRLRYLGRDYYGVEQIDGEIYIDMDNNWTYINSNLVSYTAGQSREVEAGTIFTGTTTAKLNGKDDIIVHIEWDPVKGDEPALWGKIIGYTYMDELKAFMSKGMEQLQSGDRLDFYFDYYDLQGKELGRETYGGTMIVTNPDYVVVRDYDLRKGDLVFFGVLTDVYQRELLTEQIDYHIN